MTPYELLPYGVAFFVPRWSLLMWFFMNSCYILSGITLTALIVGFVQSFTHAHIFQANHLIFMVLVSIIYFFTETLVIFFFVGTGVSIKEYCQKHKMDSVFGRRSLMIKRRVYPPLLLNIFLMIIVFIMVGAVDTHRLSPWIYQITFALGIIHFMKVKIVQNECFRDNTQVILEMSGIK